MLKGFCKKCKYSDGSSNITKFIFCKKHKVLRHQLNQCENYIEKNKLLARPIFNKRMKWNIEAEKDGEFLLIGSIIDGLFLNI